VFVNKFCLTESEFYVPFILIFWVSLNNGAQSTLFHSLWRTLRESGINKKSSGSAIKIHTAAKTNNKLAQMVISEKVRGATFRKVFLYSTGRSISYVPFGKRSQFRPSAVAKGGNKELSNISPHAHIKYI